MPCALSPDSFQSPVRQLPTHFLPQSLLYMEILATKMSFLHVQINLARLRYSLSALLILQRRPHPLAQERVHLLRRASDKAPRIQQIVQFVFDRVKIRVPPHALDEVVREAEVFHLVRGFLREHLSNRECESQ
jgi:hypothetical protein